MDQVSSLSTLGPLSKECFVWILCSTVFLFISSKNHHLRVRGCCRRRSFSYLLRVDQLSSLYDHRFYCEFYKKFLLLYYLPSFRSARTLQIINPILLTFLQLQLFCPNFQALIFPIFPLHALILLYFITH